MAKLLIRAVDNTVADPVEDRRSSYKAGDIVMVVDDDHVFGMAELSNRFRIESVPGQAAAWQYLMAADNRLALPKSLLKMPRLRHTAMRQAEVLPMRRRRYAFTTQIESKSYAADAR